MLKKFLNCRRQLLHFGGGGLATHDMAVLIEQKFGEIPLDIIGQEALAILLLFHPRPQGMRIFAVHIALGRQIALVVVLGDKLFHAGVVERFLAAELIAWEDDEFDAFWRVLKIDQVRKPDKEFIIYLYHK